MFRRFGSAEVLSVHAGAGQQAAHVRKQAHRAVFAYEPREGYLYVRSRAISSRCNDNFDFFGADEIKKAYRTFVGKPVFVNHHNSDHRQARGVIIDAALHEDRNPNGSPDTWVEVLMEVDGRSYPKLAQALVNGDIDRTSMGCDVQISKCSVCGNAARNPLEYCRHIPGMKGKTIFQMTASGQREGKLVYEECFGLSFFENSLLVEPPADPTAFFLGQVDVGPGLGHLAKAAAHRRSAAYVESEPQLVAQTLQRTASHKTAGFLDNYPPDHEIDQMRNGTHPDNQGGFGGNREPWKPYRSELENRPEPETRYPKHVALESSSREHGSTYKEVAPGTRGAFMTSSPSDEYHGPYEVVRHPETGRYHVVDNQNRNAGFDSRGIEDVHQAQHARDYIDHRRAAHEQGRALADSIFNKSMDILDPGGTEESRHSERNTHAMNNLLDHGYQPEHIKFDQDDDDRPFGEVHHVLPGGRKSGWFGRDYGGTGYLHIHHVATGDEAHDAVHLAQSDENGRDYRIPGYGPTEAHQDLDDWHNDAEGGMREHIEANDPRIQRWKRRNPRGASRVSTGARKQANQQKADAYLAEHPIGVHHILSRVEDAASDAFSLHSGMKWYDDAHGMARTMAAHHDVPLQHVAGALGVYSASSAPAPNFHMASEALHHGRGVYSQYVTEKDPETGKARRVKDEQGNEIFTGFRGDYHHDPMASEVDAKKVDRIFSGEHYDKVIGSSKTRSYARLIHDPNNHHDVVIDRHAVAAAVGHYGKSGTPYNAVSGAMENANKTGGGPLYEKFANAYRDAANRLNTAPEYSHLRKHLVNSGLLADGEKIRPHQVQALAWIAQKKISDAHGHDMTNANQKAIDAWQDHYTSRYHGMGGSYQPHHPVSGEGFYGQEPTNSTSQIRAAAMARYAAWQRRTAAQHRIAYGETKAPQDVDTLRDESCAVCGNDVAFDGRQCDVCGYMAPPKGLDDPDVNKARQLDQLKDSVDGVLDDADPSRKGADFDAGDLDQMEPGGDNSANPWLACSNCGTEMRPTAPQTTGETAPGAPGADAPEGPADGDPCPVCGKGVLAPTGVSEDDSDAELAAEQDAEDPDAVEEGAPGSEEGGPGADDPDDDPAEEPDEDGTDAPADDDEDDPKKKSRKNPVQKASRAMKNRDHSKEFPMQNGLATLANLSQENADLRRLVEAQQHHIASLTTRAAKKDNQVDRLTRGLSAVANLLGDQASAFIRTAMLKQADEQNPAQPVPQPAPQPATQSTPEVNTPEAFADVRMPGMVPGSNNDVAADAVTTAYTPGQDIAAPAVKNLVDVTAPVDGTTGPRPLHEVRTQTDVRVGNPMNPQVAFPLGGPFANAQRTSGIQGFPNGVPVVHGVPQGYVPQPVAASGGAATDLRTYAALRLARLRIAMGTEQGEDITVAQKIASDGTMSNERIAQEIETLNQVRTAAQSAQQGLQAAQPPRGAVPRAAQPTPQRLVPQLGATASYGGGFPGFQTTASSQQREDEDLAAVLA